MYFIKTLFEVFLNFSDELLEVLWTLPDFFCLNPDQTIREQKNLEGSYRPLKREVWLVK